MSENTNNNSQDKKGDKSIKPRFNSNWIFLILAVSIILFEVLFTGKQAQKATTSMIKDMIASKDIEKLVVVNKEQVEIFLTKTAVESGRYKDLPKPGTSFGVQVPKPHFTYNIGDISTFEPFIIEIQKNSGYTE